MMTRRMMILMKIKMIKRKKIRTSSAIVMISIKHHKRKQSQLGDWDRTIGVANCLIDRYTLKEHINTISESQVPWQNWSDEQRRLQYPLNVSLLIHVYCWGYD